MTKRTTTRERFAPAAARLALLGLIVISIPACRQARPAPAAPDRHVEVRFLIPVADAVGTPFDASRFRWLEEELTGRFGGFTYEGLFRGAYRDRARMVEENSRRYVVALRQSALPELLRFLEKVKTEFKQKTLYVSISQGEVLFL